MHARLLLSQDIFSFEKNPTTWLRGWRGALLEPDEDDGCSGGVGKDGAGTAGVV